MGRPSGCERHGFHFYGPAVREPQPTETENEINAHQHIRIGLALLLEDREHWHSRDHIAAFLKAELDHAFEEAA